MMRSEENGTKREALWEQAKLVSELAYSPYSGVKVGAAVLDSQGRIHSGCNVENASYGLTQCAERNALATAIAAGARPGELVEIAVYATSFEVLSPCGACRQVMVELLSDTATVHCGSDRGSINSWPIESLFPSPFKLEES